MSKVISELTDSIEQQQQFIAVEKLAGNIVKEEFHKGALFGLGLAISIIAADRTPSRAELAQQPITQAKTSAEEPPTPEGEICHCEHGDTWRELPNIISCTPLNFCASCGGKLLLT